jgi:hypothetical protein
VESGEKEKERKKKRKREKEVEVGFEEEEEESANLIHLELDSSLREPVSCPCEPPDRICRLRSASRGHFCPRTCLSSGRKCLLCSRDVCTQSDSSRSAAAAQLTVAAAAAAVEMTSANPNVDLACDAEVRNAMMGGIGENGLSGQTPASAAAASTSAGGKTRKNTSFKITNVLPSRPPSNDQEESGEEDSLNADSNQVSIFERIVECYRVSNKSFYELHHSFCVCARFGFSFF